MRHKGLRVDAKSQPAPPARGALAAARPPGCKNPPVSTQAACPAVATRLNGPLNLQVELIGRAPKRAIPHARADALA